jgi:hypothetical protein
MSHYLSLLLSSHVVLNSSSNASLCSELFANGTILVKGASNLLRSTSNSSLLCELFTDSSLLIHSLGDGASQVGGGLVRHDDLYWTELSLGG